MRLRIEAQVKLESASGGREVDTDSPVDCTPATDMLDVTRLPNGRMLDVEDGGRPVVLPIHSRDRS